ncbi:MAG TPA: hypothetical protein DC054_14090 [Blastocatellia bacterium]|nr:hypothetical protein [Blastocatellia bacterium]
MQRIESNFIVKGTRENDKMNEESVTDTLARRFLLGEVDDFERKRIERLFISEPEINTKILLAEDDLIEDYLENSLTPSDRDKFLGQYGYTAAERQKLRIAKSIKEYAAAEARLTQTAPAIATWRTFLASLRQRRMLFIPIAAVLTLSVLLAAAWLVQLNLKKADENNRRLVIERELAELNARPGAPEDPSRVPALILLPISIRSVGPQTEMKRRADIPVVQLDLLSNQKDKYRSYQAVVRRVGTNDHFKISGLQMENGPKGNFIRVKLPIHLLQDGFYQVVLSPDSEPSANEEYSFTVSE